jgi:hypothetical protein
MVKKITIIKDVIVTILIAGISTIFLGGGIPVTYAQSITSPNGSPEGHPLDPPQGYPEGYPIVPPETQVPSETQVPPETQVPLP